jgi:hypothetical protein
MWSFFRMERGGELYRVDHIHPTSNAHNTVWLDISGDSLMRDENRFTSK